MPHRNYTKRHQAQALVKKARHQKVTPKFAKIVGQITGKQDQTDAERKLMLSHLKRLVLTLKELTKKHNLVNKELFNQVSKVRYKKCFKG